MQIIGVSFQLIIFFLVSLQTKLKSKQILNIHNKQGYFTGTSFEDEVRAAKGPITFYDSNSGKPLFVAPINRSVDEFIEESKYHGWPSFRDQEVVWDNVRVLKSSGETVSVDGTHLGHNLPDRRGNRYCINLVSVAGNPV